MLAKMNQMVDEGQTDSEITSFFVARFGDDVLAPPFWFGGLELDGMAFDGSVTAFPDGHLKVEIESTNSVNRLQVVQDAEKFLSELLLYVGADELASGYWFSNVMFSTREGSDTVFRQDVSTEIEDGGELLSALSNGAIALGATVVARENLHHGGGFVELKDFATQSGCYGVAALLVEPRYTIDGKGPLSGSAVVITLGGVPDLELGIALKDGLNE